MFNDLMHDMQEKRAYEQRTYTTQKFHNAYTPLEGIGAKGGYYVSHASIVREGYNLEDEYVVMTCANAYAPGAEQSADNVHYVGYSQLIVDGMEQTKKVFKVWDYKKPGINQPNYTYLGSSSYRLPTDANSVQLKISISYGATQFYNGSAGPINPYSYTFTIK